MVQIDILYLVDRLEAAISKGFVVPFSAKRLIDEDECLDIIEQMRIAVPDEIRQARRVTQEKERVLAQAKEEADRVVALAQEQATRMIEQHEISRNAQDRAQVIEHQATAEAQVLREDADQYVRDVLLELQQRLDEMTARLTALQGTVNNGLSQLTERTQGDKVPQPPPPPRPREPIQSQ
ncbi:MAG: hypothetical protein WCF84_21925 [Anaerolineae bacterium]